MSKRRKYLQMAVQFGFMALALSATAFAQGTAEAVGDTSPGVNKPVAMMIALAGLSLAPFIGVMVTSFVKISVVLSMVRRALGLQQIPPNQVITGLAMILTVYIMMPVGLDVRREVQVLIDKQSEGGLISDDSMKLGLEAFNRGKEPLRKFLLKHSHTKDRDMFYKLARKMRVRAEDRENMSPEDFSILMPAFVISELKESFEIGFLLYVPFTVIDMVTSNILQALGMSQLSPQNISLPFKILLFVMIDGWFLISRGLVLGYM